jgi:hypothetical protein
LLEGNPKALVDVVMASVSKKVAKMETISGSKYAATLDNIVLPADRVKSKKKKVQVLDT